MSKSQHLLDGVANEPALDVLVVGAGPVGLLAAIELVQRGCTVRLIDALEQPVTITKASGLAARSMEVLPEPVVEKILRTSLHVKKAKISESDGVRPSKKLIDLNFDAIRGYHGIRCEEQWRTELFLTEHLQTLPDRLRVGSKMRVERGCEIVTFSEIQQGVECELKHTTTSQTERVSAKFLLGCDGGRSLVRKKLGFLFDGETTAEYFFALHAGLDNYAGDSSAIDIYYSKGKDPLAPGFAFVMPMPDGGFLVTCDLDKKQQHEWKTGELDRFGQPLLRQPSAEEVCEVLKQRGCGPHVSVRPGTVKWIAHFRVSSRQADHYGKGRIYLAGDACHCHSPLGAQGMNMGFQDAKNISWKIAFAAKGTSPLSILSTYEIERHGIEKKICHAIEKAQKASSNRNPVFFWIRGRGQRFASVLIGLTSGSILSGPLSYGSQQAWTYSASMLSVEHWERPAPTPASLCPAGGYRRRQNLFRWTGSRIRAGDSVPDVEVGSTTLEAVMKRSRGWTLLLFEGDATHNDDLRRFVRDAEVLNGEELRSLGESLRTTPDATGHVAGIDEVVMFPADAEGAHATFGVHAQCLFLVRPDHHVGLRSEPVRVGVVHRYFKQVCGMRVPECAAAPTSSTVFDPLPVCVYGLFFLAFLSAWLALGCDNLWLELGLGFSAIVLVVLVILSRPAR